MFMRVLPNGKFIYDLRHRWNGTIEELIYCMANQKKWANYFNRESGNNELQLTNNDILSVSIQSRKNNNNNYKKNKIICY